MIIVSCPPRSCVRNVMIATLLALPLTAVAAEDPAVAVLNQRLTGRDFIATDRFSVADITAVVAVDFARIVKRKPGDQHTELLRWRAAMAQRPSMAL